MGLTSQVWRRRVHGSDHEVMSSDRVTHRRVALIARGNDCLVRYRTARLRSSCRRAPPRGPSDHASTPSCPLRLSKEGAPDDTITINTVLYRKQVDEAEEDDGDDAMAASVEGEGEDDEADGEMEADGDDGGLPQLPQWVLEQAAQRASAVPAAAPLALHEQEPLGGDAEMGNDAEPPPPPPAAAAPPSPRQKRERKRKERYGDNVGRKAKAGRPTHATK
jgi:hypothetical protein